MITLKEQFQTADWKSEKQVPLIEISKKAKKGELIAVKVSVGQEVAHPNKTEHQIRWIDLAFLPEGDKSLCQIGKAEFCAHGASAKSPDTSTVYTNRSAVFSFKTEKPGTILASSFCNIHGLWRNAGKLAVE